MTSPSGPGPSKQILHSRSPGSPPSRSPESPPVSASMGLGGALAKDSRCALALLPEGLKALSTLAERAGPSAISTSVASCARDEEATMDVDQRRPLR